MTIQQNTRGVGLRVGDIVVYGFHGVCRVSACTSDGVQPTVVLDFRSGLRVTLPVERAQASVRALATASVLAEVAETLAAEDAPPAEVQWSKRFRAIQAKLVSGHATGLAEVVRDGARRERLASRPGSVPSPAEQELYQRARRLLVEEVSAARGIELLDAEEWIETQLAR
jgi:RNA polymerase-interacting CarD/CdnL/TRCF family regulator